MKIRVNQDEVYVDGILYENLENIRKMVEQKWDSTGYICGYEGDGKSRLASQIAYIFDPTYCLDRCVFTPEQFEKAIDTAKSFQAIVFDEAHQAFNTSNRFDKVNRTILSKLTMIRKKQLYIIIVAPTFFDINKYIVIHRSRYMVHVYSEGLERGFFRFFNREAKHKLYIEGKQFQNMYATKPNFTGRFTNFFPLDEVAYEAKKDAAFAAWSNKDDVKKMNIDSTKAMRQAEAKLIDWLSRNRWLKMGGVDAIAREYMHVSPNTLKTRRSLIRGNLEASDTVLESVGEVDE